MEQIRILNTKNDTKKIAAEFSKFLNIGDILALSGELGAGKTCFTQMLCKALGVKENVTSPSYVLMNEYVGKLPIAHLDLYRLNSEDEVLELGLEDIFESRLTIIEWPEIAEKILPNHTIKLQFEILNDKRKVRVITTKKGILL